MKLLMFVIGFLIGGLSGVTIMCLLQINRLHKNGKESQED